jgi:hypothetical protein
MSRLPDTESTTKVIIPAIWNATSALIPLREERMIFDAEPIDPPPSIAS